METLKLDDGETIIGLQDFDVIILSLSGGKDSHAMCILMALAARIAQCFPRLVAIHADTGAEWVETREHCEYICKKLGIPLHIVTPFERGLPERIVERCTKLAGQKPGWPDSCNRYCTSDCKRSPIQKKVRELSPTDIPLTVLILTGERADESPHRAKLNHFEFDKKLSTKMRKVWVLRPMMNYSSKDVFNIISKAGHEPHVAYSLGNDRLSCAMCVLANENDIRNGAKNRPDLAKLFVGLEESSGFTFRHKRSLKHIIAGTPPGRYTQAPAASLPCLCKEAKAMPESAMEMCRYLVGESHEVMNSLVKKIIDVKGAITKNTAVRIPNMHGKELVIRPVCEYNYFGPVFKVIEHAQDEPGTVCRPEVNFLQVGEFFYPMSFINTVTGEQHTGIGSIIHDSITIQPETQHSLTALTECWLASVKKQFNI